MTSGAEAASTLPVDQALRLLRDGELEVVGRLVDASNATLYCKVRLGGLVASCVHKPIAGERPLWDFPDGSLANREVAAYAVSEAGGWGIVPPTVMRDGPFGHGMCQLWIDVDEDVNVAALLRADDARLRVIALFDAVVNNADRKGGHLLPTADGRIYAVDHGVCFAADDKLRTVLWNWAGEPLEAAEIEVLSRIQRLLNGGLGRALGQLLAPDELAATIARVHRLVAEQVFPMPGEDWPAVPWPPF